MVLRRVFHLTAVDLPRHLDVLDFVASAYRA